LEKADRTCQRDGFPLVKIKGHWECVAEYLDRCIGGQCVVDVVQRGASYYFVFENGHELPLLCFCCGMPLLVEDLGKVRRTMGGRRLEAMSVGLVTLEDNSEVLQFRLEFSSKGLLGRQPPYEPISIQAAAQMRHPDDCPYGGGQPAKSRPRPKQRRKR
jgi:hypothetical protein